MNPAGHEEAEPSANLKPLSVARQALKEKKRAKAANVDLQIERIIGITSKGKNSFAYNPVTGDLAYPAGSIAILYNPKINKQTRYFFSSSRKSITALCFSPDGKYLAIATKGLDINIWDLHSNNAQPEYNLKGHKYGIDNIMFSPNMKYFVSIGDANDKGLFIWDWTSETILTKNKVNKKINSAVFTLSGQHLITAGEQHLKFWFFDALGNILFSKPKDASISIKDNVSDISVATNATSANTNIIEGKSANLGKMADKVFMDITHQGSQIFAITLDGILCIINENTRSIEKWMDLKVPSGFSVLTTQNYLVCACGDGFIRFFKIANMEHIFVLPKPPSLGSYNIEKGAMTKLASHPNEKYADAIAITFDDKNQKMATLYSDRTVFIWDLKSVDRIVVYRSFLNHSGAVYDIQPLPAMSSYEITFFATGSNDKTVRIWHVADSENKENEKVIKRNAYCKNLSRVIYINENYDHFKVETTGQSDAYANQDYQIRCIKNSPEGDYLAAGDQVGYLRIFSLSDFQLVQELKAHDQEILCIDFSPENDEKVRFLATGSRDRLIHVYDLTKNFGIVTTLDDHTSSISALRFCYDKNTKKLSLVSCGADKTMIFRVYNSKIKNFETSHVEVDKVNKFHSLELHQEANQVVVGQEKKISIWQADTGKQKCVYETKDEDFNAKNAYLDNLKVVVDMTGSYIAVSNKDGIVRIRDYYTGNLIAKINCGDFSTGMCFTQNNKSLITTTADGCVLIWKLPEEMTNNMDKKKTQLGIIVRKLSEMLEMNMNDYSLLKDFRYDSLLIEKELKEYKAKQAQEEKVEGSQLLSELEALTEQNAKKEAVTPTRVARETMDPDKFARIFNTSELPAWARTKESIIPEPKPVEKKEEEKPITGGKWRTRLENQDYVRPEKSPLRGPAAAPIQEEEQKDVEEHDEEKEEAGEDLHIPQKEEVVAPRGVTSREKAEGLINLGHGVHISSANPNPEKEIEEDIEEERYQDEKFENDDEIEENLEGAEEKPEAKATEGEGESGSGVRRFVSPSRGAVFNNWDFIEQNYEKLDKENLASPLKSPGDQESLSTRYRQGKNSPDRANPNEVSPGVEVVDLGAGEDSDKKNVVKYRAGGAQPRETLFDVNAIKNQMSKINETLEGIEQSKVIAGDVSKVPKSFQYFDQSRTFLSSFDVGDIEKNQSLAAQWNESEIPLTDKLFGGRKDVMGKSPGGAATRYTPEKTGEEKDLNANLTPNSSGVLKIDKKNLVPTTLERLAQKNNFVSTPPPQNLSRDADDTVKSKSIKSGKSGGSKGREDEDVEVEIEKPYQLAVESERYDVQHTESPSRISPSRNTPGEGQKEEYWTSHTSTFQKVTKTREEQLEAELEESFNLIKSQLGRIDSIMKSVSAERSSAIKDKLLDKFDKGFEDTRRSVDMLSVRSSRGASGMSQMMDVSQSMSSEAVLLNSRDLLDNYSKTLLQMFEKKLDEKLNKK